MLTSALAPGGIEAQTGALQRWELSQQSGQTQQNVHSAEEEGWIAVLNPQLANPTVFRVSPWSPAPPQFGSAT